MKALVTGGCGFAGHHLVEHLLAETDWWIVVLDSLSYAGKTERLTDSVRFDPDRVQILWHDLRAPLPSGSERLTDVDVVYHLAAASHVDRSLADPTSFIHNNVMGTVHMLDWARNQDLTHFFQISTDEVYGPAPEGYASKEWDPIIPSNPYAASKAAQEAIAQSYWRAYGVPVVISNTMNMFGERQDPEKFLPWAIREISAGNHLKIHGRDNGDGTFTSSSRHWIHARAHADALLWLTSNRPWPSSYGDKGVDRCDRWNVVGIERSSEENVRFIASVLGVEPSYEFMDYHAQRPGHDHRYALDGTKLAEAGWAWDRSLEESMAKVIRWEIDNPRWLKD